MSTQRRDGRSAPTTVTGRRSMRHGSRLAHCKDRAIRSKQADAFPPRWNFPALAFGRTAIAALDTLRQDHRRQQHVRPLCPGSPPFRQAAALEASFDCLIGYPPISSPAVFAPPHRTLPHEPAAFSSRTERYDGKRNLYFQHAA